MKSYANQIYHESYDKSKFLVLKVGQVKGLHTIHHTVTLKNAVAIFNEQRVFLKQPKNRNNYILIELQRRLKKLISMLQRGSSYLFIINNSEIEDLSYPENFKVIELPECESSFLIKPFSENANTIICHKPVSVYEVLEHIV